MQKLMIIEDDPAIRDELTLLLGNEGYQVFSVIDFDHIPEQAAKKQPHLMLLDINLPGQDGFSLCAVLRKAVSAPIIFVTSRDSGSDEVRALSLGGDDYITKPYSVPVLLARIKAVLRRSNSISEPADVVEAAGLRLSLTKGTLTSGEKAVKLTRNEIQIMACLMEHAGEIVSRADLIDALWDNQIYMPAIPSLLIAIPFILDLAQAPEPGVMVGMNFPAVIVGISVGVFFLIYAVYILLAYTSLKRNVLPG